MKTEQEEIEQEQTRETIQTSKKRVHWPEEDEQELKAHEVTKSRKKVRVMDKKDQKLYDIGKATCERFAKDRDFKGLLKYCSELADDSKRVQKARSEYGYRRALLQIGNWDKKR